MTVELLELKSNSIFATKAGFGQLLAPIRKPPQQDRSRKATEALLRAALKGIEARGIETLSMVEVAADAGSSIGSLYFRFGDKSRLVDAALALALGELRQRALALLAKAEDRKWPARRIVREWLSLFVDNVRARRTLLRELIRHTAARPKVWHPIREMRGALDERLMTTLRASLGRTHDTAWEVRFRIGLQTVAACLLHMVIIDLGPMRIDDAALKTTLYEIFLSFVDIPENRAGHSRGEIKRPSSGRRLRLGAGERVARMPPMIDRAR